MISSLYRDKEDVVDREEDDTVEYSLRQLWYFNQEKSIMSENVEIYAFHPLMIAITLIIQRDKPSTMGVISMYLMKKRRTNNAEILAFVANILLYVSLLSTV